MQIVEESLEIRSSHLVAPLICVHSALPNQPYSRTLVSRSHKDKVVSVRQAGRLAITLHGHHISVCVECGASFDLLLYLSRQ